MHTLREVFSSRGRQTQSRDAPLSDIAIRETLLHNLDDKNFVEGWLSFYDLLELPWWRRAWVQQEFICSPAAVFLYEGHTIPWSSISDLLPCLLRTLRDMSTSENTFSNLLDRLRSNTPAERDFSRFPKHVSKRGQVQLQRALIRGHEASNSMTRVETLLEMKKTWEGNEDLKWMLSLSRHCQSSDPRDRVFAFLGLSDPGYAISADYSASNTLEQVLIHAAYRIIDFEGDLGLLSHATGMQGSRRAGESQLPSWVPDWTLESRPSDLVNVPFSSIFLQKPFLDKTLPSVTFRQPGQSTSAVLSVLGHKFDWIEREPNPWLASSSRTFTTSKWHSILCMGSCKKGDELWCLIGAECLFILRPEPNQKDFYTLVGGVEQILNCPRPVESTGSKWMMNHIIGGCASLRSVRLL